MLQPLIYSNDLRFSWRPEAKRSAFEPIHRLYSRLNITKMPYIPILGSRKIQEDEEAGTTNGSDNATRALPQSEGATLIPWPVATAISHATGAASLSIRAGTSIAGWGIYVGRETTLKSLSVATATIQQVLTISGTDMMSRSDNRLSQEEVGGILEKSVRMVIDAMLDYRLTIRS